jgi:hypothetical protein
MIRRKDTPAALSCCVLQGISEKYQYSEAGREHITYGLPFLFSALIYNILRINQALLHGLLQEKKFIKYGQFSK